MAFTYITENLAGMERPCSNSLEDDLTILTEQGIRAVVCLLGKIPEEEKKVLDKKFDYLHLPIEDLSAPTIQQIMNFVNYVHRKHSEDKKVVVHCNGGCGRTGTMLAAYLLSQGYTVPEAVKKIKGIRDVCFESDAQYAALLTYEAHLNAYTSWR